MKGDDEENELSFILLATATANTLRYLGLDKKEDEKGGDEHDSCDEKKQRALDHLEFVKRRLRDIRRFEDRAAGKKD